MKFKIALLLIAQVAIGKTCLAQNSVKSIVKELQIGDQVPQNMIMGEIMHHKSKTIKFSDFKGKMLIIDFWNTHCGPCIAALPKFEKLQKQFGDKIAIIPVTYESISKARSYFDTMNLKLPTIGGDTILRTLFPHESEPHEIWIDEKGKVLAITFSEEVNAEVIQNYLVSGKLSVKQKKEIPLDEDQPLFVNNNGGNGDKFKYRSILTDEIDGITPIALVHRSKTNMKNINAVLFANLPSILIYSFTYTMGRKPTVVTPSRTVIETRSTKFQPMEYFEYGSLKLPNYNDTSKYCFNLTLSKEGVDDSTFFRKYMLDDLNRNFNLNGRIEKRKINVWRIIKKDTPPKSFFIKEKGDLKIEYNLPNHEILTKIENIKFSGLIDWLQTFFYASPLLINETGYMDEIVSMEFNTNYIKGGASWKQLDLKMWKNIFNKYGMDIVEEKQEAEVLVLTIPDKETPTK